MSKKNGISEFRYCFRASTEAALLKMAVEFAQDCHGPRIESLQIVLQGLCELKEVRDLEIMTGLFSMQGQDLVRMQRALSVARDSRSYQAPPELSSPGQSSH